MSMIAFVIVAAGRGERAGQPSEGPKQFRRIGGKAVIAHTLEQVLSWPQTAKAAVALHADDGELFARAFPISDPRVITVTGGQTRQASVLNALRALAPFKPDQVFIHDGVRPFAGHDLFNRIAERLDGKTGVLPALPVTDTLKRGAGGLVAGTVDRNRLYAAQTPQAFPFAAILGAHEKAADLAGFTDDAAIAEWAGIPVVLCDGSVDNVKLTLARDIALADERLAKMRLPDVRTGNGYDVHSFEPGDHVTLCGVRIAHDRALSGHSDADVGLHALTDALLATCGAGDIGDHFPPSDPQWRGAASHIFVRRAAKIVRAAGGRIANADVTLISEAPKIAPHRQAMVQALADMLGISADRCSVKATTNESLGFIGRREGIAAIATASVVYPGGLPE